MYRSSVVFVVYQHDLPLIVGTSRECCNYLNIGLDKFYRLLQNSKRENAGRKGAVTIYRVEDEDDED